MQKYGHDDARPILERASARETAARVALGEVAQQFLEQALGVEIVSHVVAIGAVTRADGTLPGPGRPRRDRRRPGALRWTRRPRARDGRRDRRGPQGRRHARRRGRGAWCYGLPPGLGSFVQWDRRLDARLAGALMGIQAIKGVEIGDGFATAGRAARRRTTRSTSTPTAYARRTNRAGGIEGGMTTGEVLRVRAAMKPISTVPRALATIDVAHR